MCATEKKRIDYIDLASVLSCIAVVYLHANGCFWRFDADAGYWFSANVIECLFYFAVPFFFMIPGVTLLDFYRRYSLREYLEKRIKKTVLPYIVWSIIGLLFQIYATKKIPIEDVNARFVVDGLLNGNLVSVYWFFIPLFSVYLSIPLLAMVPENKRRLVFRFIVFAGLLFNILCPFFISVCDIKLHFPLQVGVASGYLIYVMIGWLINDGHISRPMKVAIYAAAIAGFLVHLIGTYYVSVNAGEVLRTFKGYLTFPCVMYSIGGFLLIRRIGERIMQISYVRKTVKKLSKYTFSVYLLHFFVLRTMTQILQIDDTSLAFRLLTPWLIILVCVGITAIIRKVPLLAYILPV